MAISKIKSNSIADDAITSDKVADGAVSAADVADGTLTNAKLADGTVTSAKLSYPLTTFSSTGIDDNATSNAITIDSGENVGIGESTPLGKLHIKTGDSGQGTAQGEADELVIEGSGNAGINILSGDSNLSMISFGDSADANVGFIHYNHSNNAMTFRANAADRLIIHSDGVAAFNNGIALGVGTANTASNVLDDYEEGEFTPTYITSGDQLTSITYDAFTGGSYVKVGRLVMITGFIRTDAITEGTPSGVLRLSGLPFAVAGASGGKLQTRGTISLGDQNNWDTNHTPNTGTYAETTSYIELKQIYGNNDDASDVPSTGLATGSNANQLRFTGTYLTDA